MPLPPVLYQPEIHEIGAVRLGLGYPGMANVSVGIYAFHPLEIELGAEGSLGHTGLTARAGPTLALVDHRNGQGRGFTLTAPMLVGYRFWNFGHGTAHSLTVNPTLTADAWLAPHFGFELQLTVGASVTLSDPEGGIGAPVAPDGALRFGLAF